MGGNKKENKIETNDRTEVGLELTFFGSYLVDFRRTAGLNWSISSGNRLVQNLEVLNLRGGFRALVPRGLQWGNGGDIANKTRGLKFRKKFPWLTPGLSNFGITVCDFCAHQKRTAVDERYAPV